jgi:hypothetical protein
VRDATGRIVQWSGTLEDIHEWLVDHDIQRDRPTESATPALVVKRSQ